MRLFECALGDVIHFELWVRRDGPGVVVRGRIPRLASIAQGDSVLVVLEVRGQCDTPECTTDGTDTLDALFESAGGLLAVDAGVIAPVEVAVFVINAGQCKPGEDHLD